MTRRKVDFKKVFLPSDSIAVLVIVIGLFVALFLDEMAVRLIGVCIAVLGGVALFMMVSPRLTEVSMQRPPRPTESPLFMSQTTRGPDQTRQVFDSQAYRATFGATDTQDGIGIDEQQIELFPGLMEDVPERNSDKHSYIEPTPSLTDVEFGDGQSSVRVVGVRTKKGSTSTPPLAIENRAKRPPSLVSLSNSDVPETRSPDQVITGRVTESVQISDGVIVKPKSAQTPPPPPERIDRVVADVDVPSDDEFEPSVAIQDQAVETSLDETETVQLRPATPAADKDPVQVSIRREINVSSTFMVEDDEEMEASEEPRKEFDYLLNRVLMVIRSATNARTAAFFWFNREREQLVLEAKISDAADKLTDQRKIAVGSDVVSQIALEGRPEIITEINPAAELNLLPYYRQRAGTVSFVGVPVYFKGNVVGVLCADSTEQDAYTDVTVGFFGHFTKLIGGLVMSYTSKYELQQNARTLEAIQHFRGAVADGEPTIAHVIRCLFDVVIKHVDISTIGVCAYDPSSRIWTVRDAKSVFPEYAELVGAAVDMETSVVGECIRNGDSIAVSVESSAIRVTPSEPEIDLCQLVTLPMRSLLHTHGALYIENIQGTITNQDVAFAELLADLAGEMIAGIRESERELDQPTLPAESESTPPESQEDEFIQHLNEEVLRSSDYGAPLTLCYLKVDDLVGAGLDDGPAILQAVTSSLLVRIQEHVRGYDIVRQLEPDLLAVVLVAYNAQEAQFWTESLRREMANTSVQVNNRKWSATISVGVAQLDKGNTWQVLMNNAHAALELSMRTQNKVTVYS